MKRKCVVIQFRGDWPELCERHGFPTWTSGIRPCFCCSGFGELLYDGTQVGVDVVPWRVNTDADYETATSRCEIWTVITRLDHVNLVGIIAYDKRKDGAQGLALTRHYPALNLLQDDRLDPFPDFPDVGRFFELTDFPVRLVWWRSSRNTITTRRSPLFNERIGLTPTLVLCIDLLHTLFLGPMQRWGHKVVWLLLDSRLWGAVEKAAEERHRVSMLGLRVEIRRFFKEERSRRKTFTQTTGLTLKMFGASDAFKYRLKAMESFTMVRFLVQLLERHPGVVGEEHGRAVESGKCLIQYVELLKSHGPKLPDYAHRRMVEIWGRYVALTEPWNINTPKVHLMFELHHRAPWFGNPWWYHTFLDEGLNKVLKRVLRLCHQRNFEWLAMLKAKAALRRRDEESRDAY